MSERMLKALSLGVFGSLVAVLTAGFTPAQEPIPLVAPGGQPQPSPGTPENPLPLPVPGQPLPPAQLGAQVPAPQGDGIEVLAKGPVHEAFATTAEAPVASPIVAKQPPDPIEELPPDQKPEGDNVQWIPGYWSWDEENSRYLWVSGFWRQPPPGRVWVPGSWREVQGGWQWVSGFWQAVPPPQVQQPQQQPEIEYLPEPPASLEVGPTVAAPNATSLYVPGTWVWRGRYVWRPGVWIEYRPNWVWVPAHYRWTPVGYVFVEGYWDYPLATRGVLFAPVVFVRPVRPAFVYTPVYVVSEPCMVGALFVRRGYGGYYFGDYYEPRYVTAGYSAWCGTYTRNGFSIGFGVGRSWGYDPLWSYYSVTYRNTPTWHRGVGELYSGRYRGEIMRPPTTLVQQNTTINNITKVNVTNVTNNITVVNGSPTVNNKNVSNVAMLAPLKVAPDLQRTKFQAVSTQTQHQEAAAAKQLREMAVQRTKLETAALRQPAPAQPRPGQPAAPVQPRSIKLDVPKAAVTRAHVSDEKKAPPPAPHHSPASPSGQPGGKFNPPGTQPHPKVDLPGSSPKPPVGSPFAPQPKVEQPKTDPRPPTGNPVIPQPKADPKPPVVLPRTEPLKVPGNPLGTPTPKVDPKPPVVLPKFDPGRPPGVPSPGPFPKYDPKPPVGLPPRGNPLPKVEPPKGNPKPEPHKPPVAFSSPPVAHPAVAPPVQPRPAAPPLNIPPPAAHPAVAARPAQPPKAPVFTPPVQPRPAAIAPTAQPPKVVHPLKAQPAREQPKPAPPGKPAPKDRHEHK